MKKCEATKRLLLYRLPQVLMLHIKRFKYSGSSREKLTNNVTFPIKVQTHTSHVACLTFRSWHMSSSHMCCATCKTADKMPARRALCLAKQATPRTAFIVIIM